MHLRLKFLSFAVASWLFYVSSPRPTFGSSFKVVPSQSQAQTTQDSESEAEQLSQQGIDQLNKGESLEAASTFEQALKVYMQLSPSSTKDISTNTKEIEILRKLVGVCTSLKDPSKTIELSKSSLAIARELKDRDTELKLLIALGDAYNCLGEHGQAREYARASLALAQELQNPQAKAAAFVTLASAYQSQVPTPSEYREATNAAISRLTTAWTNNDHESEAKALARLGRVYSLQSNDENAIIFAQQGLKVAKENNIPTTAASALLTLAGVHLKEGEYPKVIEYAEQGMGYLQKLQEREKEGAASVILGLAYLGEGNSKQSIDLAEKGLSISQEVKSPLIEALAFIVLSLNSRNAGDYQKAIELINQSRVIAKEQQNPDLEAFVLEVRGGIYKNAGQKRQAIASYQEAISIKESFSALAELAGIYQDSNLLATAITYYKQAVNKNEEQIPQRIPGLPVWLQDSFPQAVQNISGLETTGVYRSLGNLLLAQQSMSEAQQVLELLKGQELREYTGNTRINTTASGQPVRLTLAPTEEQIFKEYSSSLNLGKRLDECQQTPCQELEQLLAQQSVSTEQYFQTLGQLETVIRNKRASDEAFVDPNQFALKAQEIVEAQPGTILIYPLVLNDEIWILWASKGGIFKSIEVKNVSQAQLEATVLKFRQLLQNRLSNIEEVQATAKQLYDWLIEPLEGELKANDIDNLVFCLDRSTRYIPMSALFDGEKYLIENYTVSTVLSANLTDTRPAIADERPVQEMPSALGRAREKLTSLQASGSLILPFGNSNRQPKQTPAPLSNNQDPRILGLGVSDGVAGFKPLPNVPAELDAIVRQNAVEKKGIYPGQELLNKAFDLFALRDNLSGKQLLHIATHSKFVPGKANQSYLLLGTGEKLTAPDIESWLNLQDINLVVLSACETALGGTGLDGREISGVGYYFVKSGAKTVMASLWNVDDQSTRLLMEQFYQNLARGTPTSPVGKAKALRQSQLAMLNNKYTAQARLDPDHASSLNATPSDSTTSSFANSNGATPMRQTPSEPQARLATVSQSVEQQDDSLPSAAKKDSFRHPYYWAPFILMGNGQ